MSIMIENNLKDIENDKVFKQKAHYIPCKIESDGAANVEKYFEPYIVDAGDGEMKATFRGHLLNGTKTPFPQGYIAAVVTESKKPLDENAERRFQVTSGFKELTYWNWDKKPSRNDHLVKALEWIDIAEVLHGD